MSSSTSGSNGRGAGPFTLVGRGIMFTGAVTTMLGIVALLGGPGNPLDYFEAMANKHDRLLELGSPKVVVIGGSNASFGIDSEALERVLCRPVVNMAMHAGLGVPFMVSQVDDQLGSNDLVILALEQPLYGEGNTLSDAHYQAVDRYPGALAHISPWHWPKVIGGVLVMRARTAWRRWLRLAWPTSPSIYHANGFNERGDFIHYDVRSGTRPWTVPENNVASPILSKTFLRHARELIHQARDKGATVVFTWPAIAGPTYAPRDHAALRSALEREGMTMLGEPDMYVLPDSAFLDTRYHLKAWGRSARTERMITDLCASLSRECCGRTP